ncbi:hypothetical protein BU26DRAFT_578078 [Trematosphaeria pertusa]|uniref:BZIP domain-containing protein n=1 Tax=Trematosphaeria pertusa TaxID=390896 RepID=A0A6A6I710_9PLEO|nr:uncharacterized protein BU26DRAFT_578078 [Trematosphaeria pertusa]KAF2245313.1 hypothetical protein BU26DRAFT_578078 [Trematosphaeria pertusa]
MDADDWRYVSDSQDRKKIQNRLAQRRRREHYTYRLSHKRADRFEGQRLKMGHCDGDKAPRSRTGSPVSDNSGRWETNLATVTKTEADHILAQTRRSTLDSGNTNHHTNPAQISTTSRDEPKSTRVQQEHYPLDGLNDSRGLLTLPHLDLDDFADPSFIIDESPDPYAFSATALNTLVNMTCSTPVTRDGSRPSAIDQYFPLATTPHIATRDDLSDGNITGDELFSPRHRGAYSTRDRKLVQRNFDPKDRSSVPEEAKMEDVQQRIYKLRNALPNSMGRSNDSNDDCARFSHIFKAMKAAGFSTFDQMAASYYTANFARSSAAYDMQRQSRIRNLRSFLSTIKSEAKSWGTRERRGWTEEIIDAAEELHAEEVQKLLKGMKTGSIRDVRQNGNSTAAQKAFFQEELPDLWSLFSQIVAASGLEQPYSSKIVLSALQVLIGSGCTR